MGSCTNRKVDGRPMIECRSLDVKTVTPGGGIMVVLASIFTSVAAGLHFGKC